MPATAAAPAAYSFAVEFGGRTTGQIATGSRLGLALPLPLLGGPEREMIFAQSGFLSRRSGGTAHWLGK
jgi:hypothetical protein